MSEVDTFVSRLINDGEVGDRAAAHRQEARKDLADLARRAGMTTAEEIYALYSTWRYVAATGWTPSGPVRREIITRDHEFFSSAEAERKHIRREELTDQEKITLGWKLARRFAKEKTERDVEDTSRSAGLSEMKKLAIEFAKSKGVEVAPMLVAESEAPGVLSQWNFGEMGTVMVVNGEVKAINRTIHQESAGGGKIRLFRLGFPGKKTTELLDPRTGESSVFDGWEKPL